MQYIQFLQWPSVGGLTINDSPLQSTDNLTVYELNSEREYIDVRKNGKFLARYKHVALCEGKAFAYDPTNREMKGCFGEYVIYKINDNGQLQSVN